MHLYLDVDGTLLRRGGHARLRGDFAPAPHLREFLDFATRHFECVWVTSRNRDGGNAAIRAIFHQAIGPGDEADAVDALLCRVAPAVWSDFKAQAMDMTQPFFWLDDAPEEESLDRLAAHGRSACWIPVAVDQSPEDLRRAMTLLARAIDPVIA